MQAPPPPSPYAVAGTPLTEVGEGGAAVLLVGWWRQHAHPDSRQVCGGGQQLTRRPALSRPGVGGGEVATGRGSGSPAAVQNGIPRRGDVVSGVACRGGRRGLRKRRGEGRTWTTGNGSRGCPDGAVNVDDGHPRVGAPAGMPPSARGTLPHRVARRWAGLGPGRVGGSGPGRLLGHKRGLSRGAAERPLSGGAQKLPGIGADEWMAGRRPAGTKGGHPRAKR